MQLKYRIDAFIDSRKEHQIMENEIIILAASREKWRWDIVARSVESDQPSRLIRAYTILLISESVLLCQLTLANSADPNQTPRRTCGG